MTERKEWPIAASWPALALAGVLVAAFAAQRSAGVDRVIGRIGFIPGDLFEGRFDTAVLSIFIDGGWSLILVTVAFTLAFSIPVSRRMGRDFKGVTAFLVFFLACGILGNVGYALLDPGGAHPSVGASGAIAGMMGASSRLFGRPDDLAPYRSPTVIGMAAAWMAVNVLFQFLSAGWTPIAWQAHIAGYAAGLFLISPALSLIGRARPDEGADDHGIEN